MNLQATEALAAATDFALSTFNLCGTSFPNEASSESMRQEGGISPYSSACLSLKRILTLAPKKFAAGTAVAALGGKCWSWVDFGCTSPCKISKFSRIAAAWELSYSAANRVDIVTVDDRKAMGEGICYVIASLPDSQRANSLLALAMPSIDCLETMLQHANSAANSSLEQQERILKRVADEIEIVAVLLTGFSQASKMPDQRSAAPLHASTVPIIQRVWPSISEASSRYSANEVC